MFVTLEMRHAPFYGWIHDLSAPDPTTLLNGFGLFPWDAPELGILNVLNIGIWPLLMGISMFLQQKLNPQPPDPVQAKVFLMMPVIFTRSEEHTSELQSLMRISYAVFCLKKKKKNKTTAE